MATNVQSNCVREIPRAEAIAQLNDELRKHGSGGQVVITRGVHDLVGVDIPLLMQSLAEFDEFDADGDPHGERDFGIFDFRGRELMWKIDYFSNPELRWGSDDPANPDATHRVLTVLLVEEY